MIRRRTLNTIIGPIFVDLYSSQTKARTFCKVNPLNPLRFTQGTRTSTLPLDLPQPPHELSQYRVSHIEMSQVILV